MVFGLQPKSRKSPGITIRISSPGMRTRTSSINSSQWDVTTLRVARRRSITKSGEVSIVYIRRYIITRTEPSQKMKPVVLNAGQLNNTWGPNCAIRIVFINFLRFKIRSDASTH